MLLIGAVFGLLAGTLIEEFNMQPFIATLSTMFLARGLASIISTDSLTFPQGNDFSFISNVIKIIDNPKISNDLSFNVGVIIALVVVAFGYVFLHHTRTGRTIYAIGGSRSSADSGAFVSGAELPPEQAVTDNAITAAEILPQYASLDHGTQGRQHLRRKGKAAGRSRIHRQPFPQKHRCKKGNKQPAPVGDTADDIPLRMIFLPVFIRSHNFSSCFFIFGSYFCRLCQIISVSYGFSISCCTK